ncbi:hypothetical protein AG1IA_03638 [Rhizoctonia solani AG-1 IA]|uniref:Uncharacterized protein n=1 Tax=Thanatephorus cucumeris (strain AG1-IA) TaxID=983506 RepID=L8WZZ6_THACA|nr:hypothetical protein AG1IA_03638 [Rhizoctonia solani AG-1 IA]
MDIFGSSQRSAFSRSHTRCYVVDLVLAGKPSCTIVATTVHTPGAIWARIEAIICKPVLPGWVITLSTPRYDGMQANTRDLLAFVAPFGFWYFYLVDIIVNSDIDYIWE